MTGPDRTAARGLSPVTDDAGPVWPGHHGPMTARPHRPAMVRYEFLLEGRLSETVLATFPELTARPGPTGGTVLFGPIEGTAHLSTLLDRFQTLGLSVVEMRRLPD